MNDTIESVMLATPDADLGLCDASAVDEVAQRTANEERCVVTARDPVTDEVIATYTPNS